nr:hypothetical protein [Tanacetum cinerariifolium]GEZ34691.1 hypothetical protein [Tanacetum cinerariifolium]
MLVQPQVQDVEDDVADEDNDHEVSAESTPPAPTPATPPPSLAHEPIPLPPQDELLHHHHLHHNNLHKLLISHNLQWLFSTQITKLKQRGRRLEKKRQFKYSGLKRLRKVGITQRVESSADTVMDDQENASKQRGIAELDADEDVTLEDVDAESQWMLMFRGEVVTTAATTIIAAQVPKVSAPRRRKGVVIQDPEETATASVIVHSEVKSKDKGKNMAGFKMDFFKGMNYTDIRPIFEKHYNSIQAFLEKGEKEIEEEGSKRKSDSLEQRAAKKLRIDKEEEELKAHLQIVVNNDDDVFTEATPLALKVPVVNYQIYHENNKPFYKIIRADGTHKLFLSFITILKNFDIEDLEMMWKLVQERFQSLESNNFLEDFLLNTLKLMF